MYKQTIKDFNTFPSTQKDLILSQTWMII
jgi:hypothetical protein